MYPNKRKSGQCDVAKQIRAHCFISIFFQQDLNVATLTYMYMDRRLKYLKDIVIEQSLFVPLRCIRMGG